MPTKSEIKYCLKYAVWGFHEFWQFSAVCVCVCSTGGLCVHAHVWEGVAVALTRILLFSVVMLVL